MAADNAHAARLLAEASKVDQEFGTASKGSPIEPGAAPGDAPPAPLTTEQELRALLFIVTKMLSPMLPSLGVIYTKANIAEIAAATAPVIDKYGLEKYIKLAAWEKEIMCASVLLPLAVATFQGVKHDIASLKKSKADHEQAAAEKKSNEGTPPKEPPSIDA